MATTDDKKVQEISEKLKDTVENILVVKQAIHLKDS